MRTAIALVILACFSSIAFGGTASPMPATVDLADGYGVIAAELILATPLASTDSEYEFRCCIHSVLAQPINAALFPAVVGDVIRVEIQCVMGGELQLSGTHNSLAAGTKFILTIKHAKGDQYVHAEGVDAATEVPKFTDEQVAEYVRLSQIAKLPPAEQSDQLVAVVGDSFASEALRFQALSSLDHWDRNDPSQPSAVATAALLRIWNDPKCAMSWRIANGLDYALRLRSADFDTSADQARMWGTRVLEPTPVNLADDNDRDNFVIQEFDELVVNQPKIASAPIISALGDDRWPMGLRQALMFALETGYEKWMHGDDAWAAAVRGEIIKELRSRNAWFICSAARTISNAVVAGERHDTLFRNHAVRDALKDAADYLGSTPDIKDPDTGVAKQQSQQAMRWFDQDKAFH